ncbi:YkgJ family cysteine cluster protein [Pseudomonas coronafaciens]|uniref:YkgJ family cysteine cluster protein n=1 Tax=Pseudomonas coronafaciens TaxID=53409 RepID=UPI0011C41DC7|nr:hypothetical protein [Pseudomonas coronafaciens]
MKKPKAKIVKKCGTCSACCNVLTIDTPELQKPADVPCVHVREGGGCTIYETRPGVCKSWTCGWLSTDRLKNNLRPDKSNILIRLDDGNSLTLQPIESPVRFLTTTDVLELIATCINSNFEIAISVPTKPGHTNARQVLNQTISAVDIVSEVQIRRKVIEAIITASSARTDLIDIKNLI